LKKIEVQTEDITSLLLPFKYENALIFSTTLNGVLGFYGVTKTSLIFIDSKNLNDAITIEVPDTIEELANITQAMEFIIQQQAINRNCTVPGYEANLTHTDKLKPLVHFMTNYEKGLQLIQGIKDDII